MHCIRVKTYQNQLRPVFQSLQAHTALASLRAEHEGVEFLVLLVVTSDLDLALQDVGEGGPSDGEVVEHFGFFVEGDVEVPASAERTDGGFDAEALPGYDLDPYWTVKALRIGCGDAGGIELLVRWVDHFVLGQGVSREVRDGWEVHVLA